MSAAKFAVIGNPIAHSLSPAIHQAFAAETGIELSYEKIYAETDQFEKIARSFFKSGVGMNVTAPFKQDAYKFVGQRDAASQAAHAVNTIHSQGGEFVGYNTDGVGLVRDLHRLQWPVQNAAILILGAGGAAQGIALPLLEAGASVTVTNRTHARAVALRRQFPSIGLARIDQLQAGWDIVINATAAGWQQQRLPIADHVFGNANCYDLGYQRGGKTSFVQQVERVATAAEDGLGMLVEQAAEAFQIWHGTLPQTWPVLNGLRHPKRQFIAGAECPRCHKLDTIYVERDLLGNPLLRSCKSCSFQEDIDGNMSINLLS
ncbi:MAG: shikimate dehydrogenase [Gammaproteobacteria bacterium]|nr:shikimate dehydrogenase [Gammaproteobacteria bacterium]